MNCSRCGLGGLKQVEGSGHHDPISRQTAFGVPGPGITPGKDMAPNTGSRARGRGLRPKSARPDLDRHRDGRRPLTRHFDRNSETLAGFDRTTPGHASRRTGACSHGRRNGSDVNTVPLHWHFSGSQSELVSGPEVGTQARAATGGKVEKKTEDVLRPTYTTNPSYERFIESFCFSNNHW